MQKCEGLMYETVLKIKVLNGKFEKNWFCENLVLHRIAISLTQHLKIAYLQWVMEVKGQE